jgi:regulator of protease activity HflC (stomatin/prohibitin superfamily)
MTSVLVILLLFVIAAVLWTLVGSTTVFEYERALRFRRGRLRGELGPGLYRYLRPYTTIRKLDVRPTQLAVSGQEVLSKDGVAVKASLSATYRIAEPRVAVMNAESYTDALYTEMQQALRAAISTADVEALLANRAAIGPQILQQCQPAADRLGLRLEGLAIRDLTLPGDLKKIFAQVVKARQEGMAALERARGETAALRNLANAAQMVQRNPQLLQLRLLQVAGQQPGTTLVLGMPANTTPLPLREGAGDLTPLPPDAEPGRE